MVTIAGGRWLVVTRGFGEAVADGTQGFGVWRAGGAMSLGSALGSICCGLVMIQLWIMHSSFLALCLLGS